MPKQPCGWGTGVLGRRQACPGSEQSRRQGQLVQGNRKWGGAWRKELSFGRCAGKWGNAMGLGLRVGSNA